MVPVRAAAVGARSQARGTRLARVELGDEAVAGQEIDRVAAAGEPALVGAGGGREVGRGRNAADDDPTVRREHAIVGPVFAAAAEIAAVDQLLCRWQTGVDLGDRGLGRPPERAAAVGSRVERVRRRPVGRVGSAVHRYDAVLVDAGTGKELVAAAAEVGHVARHRQQRVEHRDVAVADVGPAAVRRRERVGGHRQALGVGAPDDADLAVRRRMQRVDPLERAGAEVGQRDQHRAGRVEEADEAIVRPGVRRLVGAGSGRQVVALGRTGERNEPARQLYDVGDVVPGVATEVGREHVLRRRRLRRIDHHQVAVTSGAAVDGLDRSR